MLYIRMVLSIIVSLYTSRIVLQTLGVEDYGIYGVVGGVVSMFSFLNAAMSGATSRFLTYEMGRGDMERLKDTFSSAMIIHIFIALIVFILAETVGLWFLCNKLVIPEGRMYAAHWVFQLSIISMFFTVTQVPYNSLIISHEKMDIYAYVELLNVFLKLGIVYILLIGNFDKLILYAALTLGVSIIIALIYRVYCLHHFKEASMHFIWDKSLLLPMLNFSGWDLFGNMSVVFFTQGIAMVLNIFFGPILNAANSISTNVQGIIKGFAYNVIQAFRPQIIKRYAQEDMDAVNNYCVMATQYSLALFAIIAIPVFFSAEYILTLWLGLVPEHTVVFLRIVLIGTIFNLANNIVNIPIHAEGKMKLFSIVTGTCFFISVPIMYFMLKLGATADAAYCIILIAYLLCLLLSLAVLKYNVPKFNISKLLVDGYVKYIIVIIPGCLACIYLHNYISVQWQYLLTSLILNIITITLSVLFIYMDKNMRSTLYSFFKSKLLR